MICMNLIRGTKVKQAEIKTWKQKNGKKMETKRKQTWKTLHIPGVCHTTIRKKSSGNEWTECEVNGNGRNEREREAQPQMQMHDDGTQNKTKTKTKTKTKKKKR
jgi:hypothetical protein